MTSINTIIGAGAAVGVLFYLWLLQSQNRKLKQQLDNAERDQLKDKIAELPLKKLKETYEDAKSDYDELRSRNIDIVKRLLDDSENK